MTILLIEDDNIILDNLSLLLKNNNFNIYKANNLEKASKYLKYNIDLIILDVSLPDGNGFTFYKDYISKKSIKTIFLTAKDSEEDICFGLDIGGIDYVTKPFKTSILFSKINRILNINKVIKVQRLSLDTTKHLIYEDNQVVSLTSLEYDILKELIINKGRVVTRSYLISLIYHITGNDVSDNTITVYLKRIRSKIKSKITTIKNVGYIINEE